MLQFKNAKFRIVVVGADFGIRNAYKTTGRSPKKMQTMRETNYRSPTES